MSGEMPPKHLGPVLHVSLALCMGANFLHAMITKSDLFAHRWYRTLLGVMMIADGLFMLTFPAEVTMWNERLFASSRKNSPKLSEMILPATYETPGWRAHARIGGILFFLFGLGLCIGAIG